MAEVKEETLVDLSERSGTGNSAITTGLTKISGALTALISFFLVVNLFLQWGNYQFSILTAIVLSIVIVTSSIYFVKYVLPHRDFLLVDNDAICLFKKADGKIKLRSNSRVSVENIGSTLRWGHIYFKYPPYTVIGASEKAMAEVAFDKNLFQLKDEDLVEPVQVSTVLTVKLVTSDFEVEALNSETQMILLDKRTSWRWNIKALKTGKRKITLNVSAQLKTEEDEAPYDVTTLERTIEVKVNRIYTLKSFWYKNYQWIIGALTGTGAIFSILKLFSQGSK